MPDPGGFGPLALNALIGFAAVALAAGLRPWRQLSAGGLPSAWLGLVVMLPFLWVLDRHAAPAVQPWSGASLLVLFAGWPLAVLAFVPVAAMAMLTGHIDAVEALHRFVWLGVAPASLALVLGAVVRRVRLQQPLVYVLGRGFAATFVACVVCGAAQIELHAPPEGLAAGDLWIARVLDAFAEAFLSGLVTALAVAFRPQWLATYSDRLYLPPRP
ncbi:MAG: hypothetical protein ABI702_15135 [Burkholderiales bacterium]